MHLKHQLVDRSTIPRVRGGLGIAIVGIAISTILALPALTQTLRWIQQVGTPQDDTSFGVATDRDGNVYISGRTNGAIASTNAGGTDAWVAKYDSERTVLWKQQLGTPQSDESYGVATDRDNNVYIAGSTTGAIAGTNSGATDAWVAKYNARGKLLWARQFGTPQGELFRSVATDRDGNVYLAGTISRQFDPNNVAETSDGLLAKYSSDGRLLWTQRYDLPENNASESFRGVVSDRDGNVYAVGVTDQRGPDALVVKFDSSGKQLWSQNLRALLSDAAGVATDGQSNVYICGTTDRNLADGTSVGTASAFTIKYNTNGTRLWARQLTATGTRGNSIDTDRDGNAYISGETSGTLGVSNAGGEDAFVAKYDTNGNLQWQQQLGSSGNETSYGVTTRGGKAVYISGQTSGTLGSSNAGGLDAWVAKYRQRDD